MMHQRRHPPGALRTSAHRTRSGSQWRAQRTSGSRGARSAKRAVALCVLVLTSALAAVYGWRIQSVRVEGAHLLPGAVVRDAALQALAVPAWGVIPGNSVLTGAYRRIPALLREQFALAEASVNLGRRGVLSITIREQDVAAIGYTQDGGSVLVSARGDILLDATPELREAIRASDTAAALLVIIWPVPRSALGEGPLLTAEQLTFLGHVWGDLHLAGAGLRPESLMPKYGATDDFDIRTISGAVVTVSTKVDTSSQITKLRGVLHDRASPEARSAIRSIDLRYGDRVYIR
ncbi:MAG: hypothetical protein Q7T01_03855 [bacterium]|nr:hypothetical protein [bacterium]